VRGRRLDDWGRVGRLVSAVVADDRATRGREQARTRVRRVLAERSLWVMFQPIVSLETGALVGLEALARFPGRTHVGPEGWFSDAAAVGLGLELEELALSVALDGVGELPGSAYLSVNASPDFVASGRVARVLEASLIPGDRIVVEVTEHSSVSDYAALAEGLAGLRRRGVRVAVDDAGAGFASFRHIITLAPDTIKLDRALVTSIDADPARRAFAAAVVMFALDRGAIVVAEGVETEAELATVTLLGMDAAQGFLLARPDRDPGRWSGSVGTDGPWTAGSAARGPRSLALDPPEC
jgi:EAL domain-containing protein (putative c-di-GMP-specific phosphodiesterase class I)